jgi:AcrR family transcriptional regulator
MVGKKRSTGDSPHVRARHERRRAEILRAALNAFRDRGYHATTLDDIVGPLGLRKTALYHYFPDKRSILLACHRDSIAQLERILAEAAAIPGTEARLAHLVREHVRVMTDALGGSPLAFEVSSLDPHEQAAIICARDRYEHALRDILALGMREGVFRPGDPKLAAFILLGALNGIARWYRPLGTYDADAIGDAFVHHLVLGLVVDGPQAGPQAHEPARVPA